MSKRWKEFAEGGLGCLALLVFVPLVLVGYGWLGATAFGLGGPILGTLLLFWLLSLRSDSEAKRIKEGRCKFCGAAEDKPAQHHRYDCPYWIHPDHVAKPN